MGGDVITAFLSLNSRHADTRGEAAGREDTADGDQPVPVYQRWHRPHAAYGRLLLRDAPGGALLPHASAVSARISPIIVSASSSLMGVEMNPRRA